jgi:hypothetical protein
MTDWNSPGAVVAYFKVLLQQLTDRLQKPMNTSGQGSQYLDRESNSVPSEREANINLNVLSHDFLIGAFSRFEWRCDQ